MKKDIVLTFIFLCATKVEAKVCEYKYGGSNITITVEEDENKNIKATTDIPGKYDSKHDFILDSIFTSTEQCLETINVCVYEKNKAYNWWLVGAYQTLNSLLNGEFFLYWLESANSAHLISVNTPVALSICP